MSNIGKKQYDQISIPEEELLFVVTKMMDRNKKRETRKRIAATLTVACVFLLLVGSKGIVNIYSYASDIPLLRTFIQAFHGGSGGEPMSDIELELTSDQNNITFSFLGEEGFRSNALKYDVDYYVAPARLAVCFSGVLKADFESIKEELVKLEAIEDAYETVSKSVDELSFNIILKKGYNYEVMEFSNPGTVVMNFFPDAYYEPGERTPKDTIYYLRTKPSVEQKEIEKFMAMYEEEDPSQIKTQKNEFILKIGDYDTYQEASAQLESLIDKYNEDFPFYIATSMVFESPKN